MEILKMWKYTKMNVLTAICAAVYAATLIPFKGFVLIPGVTEIRPAAVLPVLFGLLFGPAGAWGIAIGNFIADLAGGTFGINCIFSFWGNFMLAYIPYRFYFVINGKEYLRKKILRYKDIILYFGILIISSAFCGALIAYGQVVFKILPFHIMFVIILINDTLVPAILGIPLYNLLMPRLGKWKLTWVDIMPVKPYVEKRKYSVIKLIMIVGGLFVFVVWGIFSEYAGVKYPVKVLIGGIAVFYTLFVCFFSEIKLSE